MMKQTLLLLGSILAWSGAAQAADSAPAAKPAYTNNFDNVELDATPSDFMVLDGGFAVKEEGGNKFLELPGAPLDSYGVLFGPTEKENDVQVTARIYGTGKGRRFPAFGIAAGGVGGYKLQISPAKKLAELYRGDELKTNAPVEWDSGQWTRLRLRVSAEKAGSWKIEGWVWGEQAKAPEEPLISLTVSEKPPTGRASVWGFPFSGTPIRFDDVEVVVTPAKAAP